MRTINFSLWKTPYYAPIRLILSEQLWAWLAVCQQLKMSSTWPATVRFFRSPDKLHMASSSKIFLFFIWAPHDQKKQDFPVFQTSSKWSVAPRCFCSPKYPEWLGSIQSAKWMGMEVSLLVWCKMAREWIQQFHLLLRLWTHESILLLHTPSQCSN